MIQFTSLTILAVVVLVAQATNLPGLLLIAGVLQGGSVLNYVTPAALATGVKAYGITPFHFFAPCVVFLGFWRLVSGPSLRLPLHLRGPLIFLILYIVCAASGAFLLPVFFSSIEVNAVIQMYGMGELSPLKFNLSHAVQSITLILIGFVLFALLILLNDESSRNAFIRGLAIAAILVVGLGCYEQLAPHFHWPTMVKFWANNPGYSQAPFDPVGFAMTRIGLPFSEPSYASVFMAAMFLGGIAVGLLGRAWWKGCVVALICGLGLVNTLGSTGLAAAGVAFALLSLWVVIGALRESTSLSRRLRASFLCCLFLLASTLGYQVYESSVARPHVDAMVEGLIINKAKLNDGVRERTNHRAMEILQETNGLGVGMGSHRASSFFASLLANTGVLGFGLFVAMLASLLLRYWRSPSLSDMQIFVITALSTATLGMGLGIPDLNMPMYWNFIFLGFVFCPMNNVSNKSAGDKHSPVQA